VPGGAAAKPRQPLALRELFCLTTLAAIAIALVLRREWDEHERWLLGLALGGTLVGILVARLCRRRPAVLALAIGALGVVAAVAVVVRDWSAAVNASASSVGSAVQAEHLTLMGVTTYAVGIVLSVGTFVAFQIAVWTTSTGKCGLAAWVTGDGSWCRRTLPI
jgi:hypothetical protein